MGGFFLEEDEVSGCWNKWRGHVGPMRQGRTPGGGCALCPRGQMVGPPGVFSVPEILKYPENNRIKILGHSEYFYFWVIFYCKGNLENRQKILFLLYLI